MQRAPRKLPREVWLAGKEDRPPSTSALLEEDDNNGLLTSDKLLPFRGVGLAPKKRSCQTQNYLRIVQRYLRMVENFAMLHYSLLSPCT
jgi:hypothetical protein